MRAEMITFFMLNGIISETMVLRKQALNRIELILLIIKRGPILSTSEEGADDDDHDDFPRVGFRVRTNNHNATG